jgi:hypothetical protein
MLRTARRLGWSSTRKSGQQAPSGTDTADGARGQGQLASLGRGRFGFGWRGIRQARSVGFQDGVFVFAPKREYGTLQCCASRMSSRDVGNVIDLTLDSDDEDQPPAPLTPSTFSLSQSQSQSQRGRVPLPVRRDDRPPLQAPRHRRVKLLLCPCATAPSVQRASAEDVDWPTKLDAATAAVDGLDTGQAEEPG